jgi:hypothetical protein
MSTSQAIGIYYPEISVIVNQGKTGGITPISLSNPSANRARTTQPTHIEIMEAFRLCLRIAASIIS